MRGKKGLGTRDFSISWLSPVGFVYSVNVWIEAPGARTERSPAGAGSWARGGGVQVDAEPGCCPQLTLPMPHPLWRHLPILANLRLLPSEPRARQCGPRLDSGGRHSTDSRHFAMTSIRGSAFSEVSMTGLGERVTGGGCELRRSRRWAAGARLPGQAPRLCSVPPARVCALTQTCTHAHSGPCTRS